MIEAFNPPGRTRPPDAAGEHHNVHIALYAKSKERPTLVIPGSPWLAADPVPGDSPTARWEASITVRRDTDGFDVSGPYVRGDRADHHLGLARGDVHDTAHCGWSAAASSGSSTSIPASSRKPCAPGTGSSPESG